MIVRKGASEIARIASSGTGMKGRNGMSMVGGPAKIAAGGPLAHGSPPVTICFAASV